MVHRRFDVSKRDFEGIRERTNLTIKCFSVGEKKEEKLNLPRKIVPLSGHLRIVLTLSVHVPWSFVAGDGLFVLDVDVFGNSFNFLFTGVLDEFSHDYLIEREPEECGWRAEVGEEMGVSVDGSSVIVFQGVVIRMNLLVKKRSLPEIKPRVCLPRKKGNGPLGFPHNV